MPTSIQSSDRLSCLPSELLLEILRDLDDLDLYHFIFTCRILHHCALNILFQRLCVFRGSSDCDLTIDAPPFLLSALHGALFVNGLRFFRIRFRVDCATFSRLLEDIRVLAALVGRSRGRNIIRLTFEGAAQLSLSSDAQLQAAVQSLVETAMKKTCLSLIITDDTVPQETSSFNQTADGKQEGPRRGSGRVSRLRHPFTNLFTAIQSTKPIPLMKGDKEGSNSVDLPVRRRSGHEDRSHKLPPSKSTFHKDTDITFRNHGHLGLSGEMPFRPLWLNWTLKFLNSDLSGLTLFTDCIPQDVLHNILSNIYLPGLAVLSLYDKTISFDALGVFLQRHSSTLTNLSLFIERPDSSQPVDSASVTRRNRIFAKQRVAFDFPKLESLSSNPLCIQWLFKGILSFRPPTSGIRSKLSKSRPHAHLPKLSMLSISSYLRFSESGFFPRLDSAFQTLAEFVKLASPHTTDALPPENAWFSVMSLNAEVIDEQSHIEWLQSHVSQGATSPLLALHTVSDLCLNPTTTLGPGGLRALPKFLALFKGLKKLTLTLRSTDALKKLDTDFWKAFRQDCPGLETLVLQTPPADVQVTMESLIDGTAF